MQAVTWNVRRLLASFGLRREIGVDVGKGFFSKERLGAGTADGVTILRRSRAAGTWHWGTWAVGTGGWAGGVSEPFSNLNGSVDRKSVV